ncbi:MAG: DUF5915 domain-containing protein, partial [Gemmatimonadota bacterium]
AGLEITDRIELFIGGQDGVEAAARTHRDFIAGETLATALTLGDVPAEDAFPHVRDVDIDGNAARIALRAVPG